MVKRHPRHSSVKRRRPTRPRSEEMAKPVESSELPKRNDLVEGPLRQARPCAPCKARGIETPAHRILPSGQGLCEGCYAEWCRKGRSL